LDFILPLLATSSLLPLDTSRLMVCLLVYLVFLGPRLKTAVVMLIDVNVR
jgi:hypothetical protein